MPLSEFYSLFLAEGKNQVLNQIGTTSMLQPSGLCQKSLGFRTDS